MDCEGIDAFFVFYVWSFKVLFSISQFAFTLGKFCFLQLLYLDLRA